MNEYIEDDRYSETKGIRYAKFSYNDFMTGRRPDMKLL